MYKHILVIVLVKVAASHLHLGDAPLKAARLNHRHPQRFAVVLVARREPRLVLLLLYLAALL